jgi:hypothetical protein
MIMCGMSAASSFEPAFPGEMAALASFHPEIQEMKDQMQSLSNKAVILCVD